jgi:hypothetical protein
MLERPAADIGSVIHRALVLAAFVCCGFVLVSFTLFTVDQLAGASAKQQNAIVSGSAIPPPAKHQGQPRQFIDGAAHDLISPFSSIVQSNNQWVTRGLPTFFAVLVYGVGLGYLARYSRGMS